MRNPSQSGTGTARSDAQFVDIVHTSKFAVSTQEPLTALTWGMPAGNSSCIRDPTGIHFFHGGFHFPFGSLMIRSGETHMTRQRRPLTPTPQDMPNGRWRESMVLSSNRARVPSARCLENGRELPTLSAASAGGIRPPVTNR
jgi:hypothetical protein